MDAGDGLVTLGVRLLDLVRDGRRTTTYKPATLLAMIEVLAASADADGRVPDTVPVRALAERVVALYWPQVREYDGLDRTGLVLRQISDAQKSSVIVSAVRALYVQARGAGVASPGRAAQLLPSETAATVEAVRRNLLQFPLARLQRPGDYREGDTYERLLYDDAGLSTSTVALQLRPGAGERLVALSALLVPILQIEWTQQIASLNGLASDDLRGHLFGRDRADLSLVRSPLREMQRGSCFYCDRALSGPGAVDHVVPWSLHQQDAIENLVLAHDTCNGKKSSTLLDIGPALAWAARDPDPLRQVAVELGWPTSPGPVFAVARAAYTHSASTSVWSPIGRRIVGVEELRRDLLPGLGAS